MTEKPKTLRMVLTALLEEAKRSSRRCEFIIQPGGHSYDAFAVAIIWRNMLDTSHATLDGDLLTFTWMLPHRGDEYHGKTIFRLKWHNQKSKE